MRDVQIQACRISDGLTPQRPHSAQIAGGERGGGGWYRHVEGLFYVPRATIDNYL